MSRSKVKVKNEKIRKIGVMGGNSIYELGPLKDIVLFLTVLIIS